MQFGINDVEQLFGSIVLASFGSFEELCHVAHGTELNCEESALPSAEIVLQDRRCGNENPGGGQFFVFSFAPVVKVQKHTAINGRESETQGQ